MTHKTLWREMIAVALAAAFAMAFMGCEDETQVREELYAVRILGVTPDLIDGVEQQLAISVEYTVQLTSIPQGLKLIIAFNTEKPDDYTVYDSMDVTVKGIVNHTFNVTVTPKDWAGQGEFQAEAYLGYREWQSSSGNSAGDRLASDIKTFPVSHDYWSIAWDLNGGSKYGSSKYPARVAKGAVLVHPNPRSAIDGYVLGGWYTDSALTQLYDFTESVTGDLTLYAKWREIISEDLYGTWIKRSGSSEYNPPPYTLTITANSVRLENGNGNYVQYTNVVWAQQPTIDPKPYYVDYPFGYTFTGQRQSSPYPSQFNNINIGIILLSSNKEQVYLKTSLATDIQYSYDIAMGYYTQRLFR